MTDNRYTNGSEYAHIVGMAPINEDYSIMVEVTAVENGIVSGVKIWDEADPATVYQARLKFYGKVGEPPDSSIRVGSNVLFHRTGEFSNAGAEGYELHTADPSKTSWICFAYANLLFVRDIGEAGGTHYGEEVVLNSSGSWVVPSWSVAHALVTLDAVSFYHEDTPPYSTGRIYAATLVNGSPNDFYLVFLPGFGDEATTLTQTVSGTDYVLSLDGQGNVLDFYTE